MKCSFAKMSTKGTFEAYWPYGTDLYGRFMYLESNDEKVLIAAFDFNGTFPKEADRWRREVAKRVGIPEKSVWYHELQIHAAPLYEELSASAMDALIDRTVDVVKDLISRAEECEVYAAECDMGTNYSFNREQYIEGLGGVTVWRGIQFDESGKAFTQNPNIMLLRGYQPELPVFDKPIYFDNTVDQMAYLFMFKNMKGETLGTVSRFAAHPDVGVLFEHSENPDRLKEYHFNYDWTGYLSDDMEAEFGGVGMYINGPCGDLATKKDCVNKGTYEASDNECKRLAKSIGGEIRKQFAEKAHKLDTSKVFKTETFDITLPMKEDFPYNFDNLEEFRERGREHNKLLQQAIADGKTPSEIKRVVDDDWRLPHIAFMCHGKELSFTNDEIAKHEVTVHIPALRFCGYLFVGVMGESLVDMTTWMRSRFTGTKTIPIDQVGGYYNYIATPRSMTLGGYTYWSSWVRRDAVPLFKTQLAEKLDEFLKDE
ncbi:MAG: hypothetical protein J6Q89_09095 [Clostridia bacterium]|nr:hypothetical protein [Clostridia bacterium]